VNCNLPQNHLPCHKSDPYHNFPWNLLKETLLSVLEYKALAESVRDCASSSIAARVLAVSFDVEVEEALLTEDDLELVLSEFSA